MIRRILIILVVLVLVAVVTLAPGQASCGQAFL